MAPPAWVGESSSSIAFSMNPRDSRVVSIYDKYLYDPKDLESSDPRRRELARKASQLKLHGRPANDMDANGLRSGGTSNPRPAQRKSIAFSQNTKVVPQRAQQQNQRPSYASASSDRDNYSQDRDSGAFGLGLGMLGGSDSESESDSDDERSRGPKNPGLDKLKRDKESDRPDSWTDRAVAVGHRPPDHASQNPPSLKLMALKSAKQSSELSRASQDHRNSSLAVSTSFVDRTSRHGSTIGFAGPSLDATGAATSAEAGHTSRRLSARTALTKQLGLASPSAEPAGSAAGHGASTDQGAGPQDYFTSRPPPNATQSRSPPRSAGPPPIDVARAQQHGFGGSQQDVRGIPSPMSSQHGSVSTPTSATPLRSPGDGSAGMPSPNYPYGQGPVPPNVLQRGPPSPYGQRGYPGQPGGPGGSTGPGGRGAYQDANGRPPVYSNSPPRAGPGARPGNGPPHPSSLQAGNGARPTPGNFQRVPGPQGPNGPQNRGPQRPNSKFGPSFSDAPGPPKRQSLFRRSMAMFGAGPQAGPPGNGNGNGPGAGTGPGSHPPSRTQPAQKRQSFFRRSIAMLTGSNGINSHGGAPPQQGGQQMRMPAAPVPRAPQAPRVQGLQNDFEKPDHPRKSQFLGAGGEGAEWDTQGEGAKFWRRFSMAQKNAGSDKLEEGSKAWMATMASGRRKLIIMGVIALVTLVGIIVGVIVWREIVSPSGSSSGEPKSVYKANLGAMGNNSSISNSVSSATTSTSRKAKATATSTASGGWYSRSFTADELVNDVIKRHDLSSWAHQLDSPRLRKRHFGKTHVQTTVQHELSLTKLELINSE